MHPDLRKRVHDGSDGSPPSEAWLFAQAILGKPIPRVVSPAEQARVKREQLERLAQSSSRHATELRALQNAEAKARRHRELLEWAAHFSTECQIKLQGLLREEAAQREAWRRAQQFSETLLITEWDEGKHPRDYRGRWEDSDKVGDVGSGNLLAASPGAGGAKGKGARPQHAFDPSDLYLPSEQKGTWVGEKGKSAFRLKTPLEVNDKIVHEIQYKNGLPVLEKFAIPGKTATIILTGDRIADDRNAEMAWRKLNPGKKLPGKSVFHHDLLHVVEETVTVDGKKIKVLVGKMQLVPKDVNQVIFHQGSASVAKHYYKGLGIDVDTVKRLAKAEASLAAKGSKIVAKAAKKIVPGKLSKRVLRFVGRKVVRAIPIIGTGLAILEFADNVEAHGIGGAVVRATPLLGDLISAYDFGSDLAKEITDDANAVSDEETAAMNAPANEAWQIASQQTIAAYNELAPQIQVTNTYGPNGLVDPEDVSTALKIFRSRMQQANLLRTVNAPRFDFDSAVDHAKRDLKERLIKAAQKNSSATHGPLL